MRYAGKTLGFCVRVTVCYLLFSSTCKVVLCYKYVMMGYALPRHARSWS